MKLLRSNPWRGNATCRVLGALFYSTEALASSPSQSSSLYQRILRAGDRNPRVSIVPVLNQWLDQGRGAQKPELVDFIAQLRKSRRFNHALQVSEWMSREMGYALSPGDISTRLDLISKVCGLQEADKYFESVPDSSPVKANCDLDQMDRVLNLMKDDPSVTMDWNGYTSAAHAFLKAGHVDMALTLLRTAEQLIDNDERKIAYENLLNSYAATGSKRDVYRIWHLYKKMGKFYNKGYLCMISSLVKLDDISGAEKILEEWESGFNFFDGQIPKLLINAYCRKCLFEKAKSYVQKLAENGTADVSIWLVLAQGYHWNGHVSEAVETMRTVASLPYKQRWRIHHSTLVTCLDYLKEKGDVESAHELFRLLREKGHLSADLCDKIENYIHGETQVESLISGEKGNHMEGVDNMQDGEACDSGAQQCG